MNEQPKQLKKNLKNSGLNFFYMQMLQVKSKFMLKFLTCNIDLILYPWPGNSKAVSLYRNIINSYYLQVVCFALRGV